MDVDVAGLTVPEAADGESEPSTPRSASLSISAGTEVSAHLRQRSAETVEAAVTLNTVAAEPITHGQAGEEDGQPQSADIMHGADLLLWAACTVDHNFAPYPAPETNTQQQQHEVVQATVAATSTKKQKPRKSRELKTPKPRSKPQRRKSLIVVLKVPGTAPSAEDEASGTESMPVSSSPHTPNWPVPGPKFTPVNIPIVPIPRPQPYRRPELGGPKLVAPNPATVRSRTSAVDALAAARKQTEQTKTAKSKVVSGRTANNTPPPGETGSNSPIHITPSPTASPVAPQISTPSQAIPRPAYAKPRPTNGNSRSAETDTSTDSWFTPVGGSPASSVIPRSSLFPTYPAMGKLFSRNAAPGNSPPSPIPPLNEEEDRAADIRPGFSAMDTAPFPRVPRATMTPEYIETKNITPLVSKNNFLYWEPSMSTDIKPLVGKSPSLHPRLIWRMVIDSRP